MHIEKKTIRNLFLIALGCIVVYWILHETDQFRAIWSGVSRILSPFVLGAVLSFILNVPMRAIEANLDIKSPGPRRAVAMFVTFTVMVLVILAVFFLVIPQIGNTVQVLAPKIVAFFQKVEENITAFLAANPEILEMVSARIDLESIDLSGLIQKVVDVLGSSVSNLAGHAFTLVGGITGAVVDGVIGIVFSLYCLPWQSRARSCCTRCCRSITAMKPSVSCG